MIRVPRHIPGALNIPLPQIGQRLQEVQGRPVVFYCRSGLRSQQAAQLLKRRGFEGIHTLGAMARWNAGTA